MTIPKEILDKYNLKTLEEFKKNFGEGFDDAGIEKYYCNVFLEKTDHIPNKIIEAQALGKEIDDYTEILNLRQMARERINELENV